MHNGKYQCHKPYGSKLHIPPINCLVAQQVPHKKVQLLMKMFENVPGKNVRRMDLLQKNDKTGRVRGCSRKMREDGKEDLNGSPGVGVGGGGGTYDIPSLHLGATMYK